MGTWLEEVRRWAKLRKGPFSFLLDVEFEAMDQPLTEAELERFEEMNGISLPEEYRCFLLTVGNGIRVVIDENTTRRFYGIPRPVEKRMNRRLKYPFVFDTAYHNRLNTHDFPLPGDCLDPESEEEGACLNCKHRDTCFYAPVADHDEFDHMVYNGAYPVCYAGCTYMYFLVVTGKHRGEVWINNEQEDFAPSKGSFSDFLQWAATTAWI